MQKVMDKLTDDKGLIKAVRYSKDDVHVIKDGIENYFSQTTWDLIKNSTDWVEFGSISEDIAIPTQEIKLKDVQIEEKDAKIAELEAKLEALKGDSESTIEEMKTYLVEKGVKVHHKTGDAKIKEIYNENRK